MIQKGTVSRSIVALVMVVAVFALWFYPAAEAVYAEERSPVYVIPVHETIDQNLQRFIRSSFADAEKKKAAGIILDVDTYGGSVEAAEKISEIVRASAIPTTAYVHGKAASAGSYIALNAGKIFMEPGSSIGAAAVVDGSGKEVENPKIVAYWTSRMRAAAELRGRDSLIAAGMADKNLVVPMSKIDRTKEKGEIIALTADEAVKVGYAEGTAVSMQAILPALGLPQDYPVQWASASLADKIAGFVTNPFVMTLLLLIGIAGVGVELLIPGFGAPGILGIAGFALYFFGHYVSGFAGIEDIVLFVAGVLMLVSEIFVPSFGILGILGIISLGSGIVLAAQNTGQGLLTLTVALVIGAVIIAIVVKYFSHRGVWHRFILKDALTEEKGYSSTSPKQRLLHQRGASLTPLRPAGTAQIGEERVDVVTRGEFIPSGSKIEVIEVEGTRVVVRAI